MKPGSRFLIGFAAFALTFGTLMATLGPQQFNAHGAHHRHHHHHGCYDEPGK